MSVFEQPGQMSTSKGVKKMTKHTLESIATSLTQILEAIEENQSRVKWTVAQGIIETCNALGGCSSTIFVDQICHTTGGNIDDVTFYYLMHGQKKVVDVRNVLKETLISIDTQLASINKVGWMLDYYLSRS